MNALSRIGLILLSVTIVTSCAVDSRWGPPRAGLRENMAWQYAALEKQTPLQPTPVTPVSMAFQPQTAYAAPLPITTNAPTVFPAPSTYGAQRGRVVLKGKYAMAPPDAPAVVRRAVEAANRLQNKPYKYGGGHAILNDKGYDCSGTVSYVLREAGLLKGQMPSRGFLKYGQAGYGKWITVWARNGHVFMTIGGLRLDTTGAASGQGPRWREKPRKKDGFNLYQITGLHPLLHLIRTISCNRSAHFFKRK